jgi:hypothetical protein
MKETIEKLNFKISDLSQNPQAIDILIDEYKLSNSSLMKEIKNVYLITFIIIRSFFS